MIDLLLDYPHVFVTFAGIIAMGIIVYWGTR